MENKLEYYLNLNYPIEVTKLSTADGGGFSACIPQLGRNAYVADGETFEEVINNLNDIKKELFKIQLANGTHIPEPMNTDEDEYSGKFMLRIPKVLHRSLTYKANCNNISLNQYTQYLITYALTATSVEEMIDSCGTKLTQLLRDMNELEYHFNGMLIKTDITNEQHHNYEPTQVLAA